MTVEILETIFILLSAVIFHECAHGWVAFRLGDPTAKRLGRLTLNPLKHIDPIGTLLVPALLRFFGFTPLGWAKAVPVNFANLHHPRRDMVLVAAAGPAVNMVLSLAAGLVLRFDVPAGVAEFCILMVIINLLIAVFNLIPVPPLDGSRIVMGMLPLRWARGYARLEPFGLLLMLVLLNLGLMRLLQPAVLFLASLVIGGPIGLSS